MERRGEERSRGPLKNMRPVGGDTSLWCVTILKWCKNSKGSCAYQDELPLVHISPIQQTVTDRISECLLPLISH